MIVCRTLQTRYEPECSGPMPTTLTIVAGAEDHPQPGDVGLALAAHEPARLAEQRGGPQRQLAGVVHRRG